MPRRKTITPEQERFIGENYLKLSERHIASLIGLDRSTVVRVKREHGWIVPKELLEQKKSAAIQALYNSRVHPEDETIRTQYLTLPIKVLARNINRSNTFVRGRLKAMGLAVPPQIIERHKIDSRIKAGNIPYTKGKRQSEYMSDEAIERTKATRFKKGSIPLNKSHFKDGDITLRRMIISNGKARYYYWVRIAPTKWMMLHIKLWEESNGPVPEGQVVAFKDGNSLNVDLSNLELITLDENMRRNTIHRYPMELKRVMLLTGKLKRKIKKLTDGKQQSNN